MKSLDALINYLLEEVALCGKQGAGSSQVLNFVTTFYAKPFGPNSDKSLQTNADENTDAIVIDRQFQEQTWKWLVNHPECRVGTHGQGGSVEAPKAASRRRKTNAKQLLPECTGLPDGSQASGAREDGNGQFPLIPNSSGGLIPSQEERNVEELPLLNGQGDLPQSSRFATLGAAKQSLEQPQETDDEVRVYVSEERMWHALAGHGVDHSKIHPLDFVCLSIIAAAGPEGILQPELVKISGQDMRSVPRRTQVLFQKGYIIKTPVLSGAARTSLCTLSRFAKAPNALKPQKVAVQKVPDIDVESEKIFRQCFHDGGANLYALLRNIFDLLNQLKIITLEDLRRRLGVIGHRWERRVLASTLRKLEKVGCVKQVRARAHNLGDDYRYFRCLKFIREPGENESQYLCGLSNVNLRSIGIDQADISDSESEVDEDDQADQTPSLVGLNNSAEKTSLQELRRSIPQWTGAGCFGNFVYELIQRAGTRGVTTMEVKHLVLGRFVSRPVENQLARLVEHWHISQPPHLRHLAIIRDTAMGKKKAHYIHYTYDHYKKLVEYGEASWEAVSNLGGDSHVMQQPDFAVDATADLDEYGFPSIHTTLFQGRQNDATIAECVNAVRVGSVRTSKKDAIAKKVDDGTYGITQGHHLQERGSHHLEVHHGTASQPIRPKPAAPIPLKKAPKPPRPKGRPRKIPPIGLLKGRTLAQKAESIRSHKAAVRYQKQKIENEIARRIDNGEDPDNIREDIFAKVTAKYSDAGEDIPTSIMELRVHDKRLSGSPAPTISSPRALASRNARSRDKHLTSRSTVLGYLPSVIAHTQPILMNQGVISNRSSSRPKQLSARLLENCDARQDKEKASLVPKPNGSNGMTYDEQSDLVKRDNSGLYLGANALRARNPGQRGRCRKCRLAIIKSTRLFDFVWFKGNPTALGEKDSTPAGNEELPEPRVLSPCFPVPAGVTRHQIPPGAVKSSKFLLADNNCTTTPGPIYTSPYSDHHTSEKNKFIGPSGSNEGCASDFIAHIKSPETCVGKKAFTVIEAANVSEAAYDEKRRTLLELPSSISPFTPINQCQPSKSNHPMETGQKTHVDNANSIPLEDILRSPIPNVANITTEGQARSQSKTSELKMPPILAPSENPFQIFAQIESENIEDCGKPPPFGPISTVLDVSPPIPDGANINEPGGSAQTNARFTKPVTITGGSVSIVRRKIIMDIMQRYGGIYSGHKELMGPFVAAWAKQNKSGKPDSKTVYTAFRSLIQAGKLRELKFSFQDPQGLMVTKSMITLTSIAPTDPRVLDMQNLIISSHPSPYIPDVVGILGEGRNPPVYYSRYVPYRALGELEIDNESQVRLQHKPQYVARLERNKAAREARKEVLGVKRKVGKDRARVPRSSKLVGPARKVERLASIRRPVASFNNEPAVSSIGNPHHGLADTVLDFPHISSRVHFGEEERAIDRSENFWIMDDRKHGRSDGDEAGENANASHPRKLKRRRLAGDYPIKENHERSDKYPNKLRQISTMMDPEEDYHATTGTFSVIFSGLKASNAETVRLSGKKLTTEGRTDFEIEVDDLLRWELNTSDSSNLIYPDWPFINHEFRHPQSTPAETNYVIDSNFKTRFFGCHGYDKKTIIRDKAPNAEGTSIHPQTPKKSHKRKRADPTLKTRRLTSLEEANALAELGAIEGVISLNENVGRPQKLRRVRGPQKQTPMTPEEEERLLAAVISIRTITGGVETNPDWVLVARLFQPKFSQMYIQKKWAHVLQRYRLQMDQIQANFQTKFAQAYEDNMIPTIDFDHLVDYDWEWLVDWTLNNIDTSWNSLQNLPSKRSDLDLLFDITASTEENMFEYFGIESSVNLQRREAVLNKKSYVYPTERIRQPSPSAKSWEVAIARTWIRANVITSAASYNSDLARAKLSLISESSVDVALHELLTARLLTQSNKGRLVPGRNYDISEYFLSRFRKKLDFAQFRRAAAFKRRLDERFGQQATVIIPYEAANGDMLAILNMLAFGRIMIKAKNPPMEKFGLTDGGYRTRRMDKSRMNFDVEIERAPTYISGNPISPIPRPPCQHVKEPMAKIPLWYDIHDQLVPVMWDMLLAATMSVFALRSSVSAVEVEQSVGPSAELWEIELLLEWMVQAGAVTKAEQGSYTVAEWWWMCFDSNELAKSSGGDEVQTQG